MLRFGRFFNVSWGGGWPHSARLARPMPDRRWPSAGVRRSGAASARCHPRVTSTATRAGDVLWLALASGCSVARWLGVPPLLSARRCRCRSRAPVLTRRLAACEIVRGEQCLAPRGLLPSASPRRGRSLARSPTRRRCSSSKLRLQPRGALPSHDDPPVRRRYHLRLLSHKPLLLVLGR